MLSKKFIGLLTTLALTTLLATASAGEFDAAIEYDTGHPLGPHFLELGVETPLRIRVVDRIGGGAWPIWAVGFDFENPEGLLDWDILGPDGKPFTPDDGFIWESGFDEDPYTVALTPPLAVDLSMGIDEITVPNNGSVLLATLLITGNAIGNETLIAGEGIVAWPFEIPLNVDSTTWQVELTVVPEPGTVILIVLGSILLLSARMRVDCR